MPNTSTGFGCFASEIVPLEAGTCWNRQQRDDEEHELANPFNPGIEELLTKTNARRRGWWLKQGPPGTEDPATARPSPQPHASGILWLLRASHMKPWSALMTAT